ncbi:hypothetical protein CLAFUW4_14248 [Fulvia fulva]|nr:hypothetical protein CLAFUW4_14248 [Fulvia fulva]
MTSYITTHNATGEAIFSPKVITGLPKILVQSGEEEKGALQIIYDNDTLRPNLSNETDIDTYVELRTKS